MTTAAVRGWFAADERRVDVVVAAVTVAVAGVLLTASPEEYDLGWPDVVAGAGAFVLLLFRRRWPLALLGVAACGVAVHVAVWDRPSVLGFAAFVLLATACAQLERRSAIVLGVAVAATLYGLSLVVNDDLEPSDGRVLITVVWTFAAVGVGDAARSWRRYREAADAEIRTAVLAADAQAEQQVAEERLAIARELHDLLAHNLSVMNVQTGAALHLLRSDPDEAESSLLAARDAGKGVLDELRELLAVLRDESDDSEPRASLPTIDHLPALVDTMRSAGLEVVWTDAGVRSDLAPAVSLAAYRIVQEALTNAAKHGAGTCAVVTDWRPDELVITVTNPIDPHTDHPVRTGSGHGLVGMGERATSNGGSFDAAAYDGGFRVHARLPAARRRTGADTAEVST